MNHKTYGNNRKGLLCRSKAVTLVMSRQNKDPSKRGRKKAFHSHVAGRYRASSLKWTSGRHVACSVRHQENSPAEH